MVKPLLRFDELFTKGKTKKFVVHSTHSGDALGIIHWRAGWRCYVMSYAPNTDMSVGCNKELNAFMEFLELERKIKKEVKPKDEKDNRNL